MSKDSESEGKAGGLPSSVPEIYFDIIGRVIPGSVAIGLYQFDSLTHTLNTPTVSFALVASYFLGMILDIVGSRLWELLFYAAQPALARRISFFRLY
jgi:hypothetical protein